MTRMSPRRGRWSLARALLANGFIGPEAPEEPVFLSWPRSTTAISSEQEMEKAKFISPNPDGFKYWEQVQAAASELEQRLIERALEREVRVKQNRAFRREEHRAPRVKRTGRKAGAGKTPEQAAKEKEEEATC